MKASKYLEDILEETRENIVYIVDTENIRIPKVWQKKILEPLAFAVAHQRVNEELAKSNELRSK